MSMYPTSFLYEIENGEPIPIGKLEYLRARTRNNLYDFVVRKFIEAQSQGLSQAELGRRIHKRPEVVNRLLGAPGNWTIDTISDLLVGISADELKPESASLLGRAPRNHTVPEWLSGSMAEQEKTGQQDRKKPSGPSTSIAELISNQKFRQEWPAPERSSQIFKQSG